MSVRTIIEINHDLLHTLTEDVLLDVVQELASSSRINASLNAGAPVYLTPAIRVFAQRHHSDAVKLTINGDTRYKQAGSTNA